MTAVKPGEGIEFFAALFRPPGRLLEHAELSKFVASTATFFSFATQKQ